MKKLIGLATTSLLLAPFGAAADAVTPAAAASVRTAAAFAPAVQVVHAPTDEELFASLIPGDFLEDKALEEYHGKAAPLSFTIGEDGVITFQGDIDNTVNADNTTSIAATEGIVQTVPVVGDNNQVELSVVINVNINTVTVQDAVGSEVNVNQVLDFNGVLSGPFAQ